MRQTGTFLRDYPPRVGTGCPPYLVLLGALGVPTLRLRAHGVPTQVGVSYFVPDQPRRIGASFDGGS